MTFLYNTSFELMSCKKGENSTRQIVWVTHNFGFLGGSLGCAEGEKITRAFEYSIEHGIPICVQSRTGFHKIMYIVIHIKTFLLSLTCQ